MDWRIIDTGYNTGSFNMDYDLELAAGCRSGSAVLRFYGWQPYCISLGANQRMEEINTEKAQKDGIDIVKRPTGGRAILHARELTYSVILPADCGLSSNEIYRLISLSLVEGLRNFDKGLSEVELETIQPDFGSLLKTPSGTACFASTAKSEVKFRGRKLIGSAQRKLNRSILQHGSLLLGSHHRNIPDYLNLDQEGRQAVIEELLTKTTDLNEILGRDIDDECLKASLCDAFRRQWGF